MISETNTSSERISAAREATVDKSGHSYGRMGKITGALTAVALMAGTGEVIKNYEGADPFHSNIPVPTETQPHANYTVGQGDTEISIAARYGHVRDTNFENMLNNQLPISDQKLRIVRPGEVLRVPIDK
jgi:LysM repeat protein